MTKEEISYKTLDPTCIVTVRRLKGGDADPARLAALRRRGPRTGIAVDQLTPLPKGTPVEVEMTFPGRGVGYRCLGAVSWAKESGDPARPHRLGIGIHSMDRLETAKQPQQAAPPAPEAEPVG
ncbi:MAG: hypothetical protein PHU25_19205 [Deltaproteobacteria bacterium]|nr:hypothetical protein [Deltaproteobacteria bacterium]